jgi:site-specific DNA-methyltransferase (adenine-specific)
LERTKGSNNKHKPQEIINEVDMTSLVGSVAWNSKDKKSVLIQNDCFETMSAVPDNSIDCIWTDPPYLLSNDGITCVAGKMVKVNKGDWDRSRGVELDHQFNQGWIAHCYRILKPAGTIWITGTSHVYLSVGSALLQQGFRILNDIIWEKPNPPPNLGTRCFTHATETVLWATKAQKGGKHKYVFHYQEMKQENGGKQMKNVWRINAPSKEEKKYGKHPTQKPLALISRCIRASTNPGEIIFDPFSGSASAGVSALILDRRFIGCELEKEFVEIAKRRLSATEQGSVNYLDQKIPPSNGNLTLFDMPRS